MGLSADQVAALRSLWPTVMANKTATGVEVFLGLFRANPGLVEKFERFQSFKPSLSADFGSLAPGGGKGDALAKHADAVIDAVDAVVKVLDDEGAVNDSLHTLGKMHTKIKDFHAEYFKEAITPLTDALKGTLGGSWNGDVEAIVKIVVALIVDKLIEGFNQ